jgi:hypothetical protein
LSFKNKTIKKPFLFFFLFLITISMTTFNHHSTNKRRSPTKSTESKASQWQHWAEEQTDSAYEKEFNQRSLHIRHAHKPAKEILDKILPSLPLCFCNKPAYRSFTLEYGPILECGNYQLAADNNHIKIKYVCGFHVHERSWNKLRKKLSEGGLITADHPELTTCPLYNFTFCVTFYLTNQYPKCPPSLPVCFCNRTVILRESPTKPPSDQSRLFEFTCANCDIEGVKPKCSWILRAKEVAFPRPKHKIHRIVDAEEYTDTKPSPLAANNSSNNNNPRHISKDHQQGLLCTLTLNPQLSYMNNFQALKIADTSVNPEPSSSNSTSGSASPRYSSLVPTSVMVKRSTSPKSVASGSHGNTCPLEKKVQEQELHISRMKAQLSQMNAKMEGVESMVKLFKRALEDMQLDVHRHRHMFQEEQGLRRHTQSRLSSIELDVVQMLEEKEQLLAEIHDLTRDEEHSNEAEKCRVCFNRPVEYVLLPCFHYGKEI